MREFFKRITVRSLVLNGILAYLVAVVGTVIVAHVALIVHPYETDSNLAARLVEPVRTALEFLDNHWKGALLILAPFLLPAADQLIRRIRAFTFGDTKVELENEGVHEKPPRPTKGTP